MTRHNNIIILALQLGKCRFVNFSRCFNLFKQCRKETGIINKPIVIFACKVLQDAIEQHLPEGFVNHASYLDYGLHRHPKKMTLSLQEEIDDITTPSTIILGYGLCGGGLAGLRAGEHTLIVPRTDDCIAILFGSRKVYLDEFGKHPGTYYLSKGWLECGSHPLKEYHEYLQRYGQEDVDWIMDQQYSHYKRLVLVAHTEEELKNYRPQAYEVARYCQYWEMKYEEMLGSQDYVKNVLNNAKTLHDGDEDFLVIPPGDVIREAQFRNLTWWE